MTKPRSRVQVPLSFNMNDPIEREIYDWLEKMRSETNKKGNVSSVIKKILFSYIDREKEREYVRNMLMIMERGDKRGNLLQSSQTDNDTLTSQRQKEEMAIDCDSLPF